MITSLLLNFLKKNLLPFLLFGLVLLAGAGLGYLVAGHGYQRDIDQTKASQSQTQRDFDAFKLAVQTDKTAEVQRHASAMAQALALKDQYQTEADRLSKQLLAKQYELDQARETFKRTIKDVIEKDGAAYTGIGPDSLCAYRTSLGYASCNNRVQDTNGANAGHTEQARSPAGGLSPSGILNHASDYGAWCQSLEAKLLTLKAYFQGSDNKDIK